MNELSYVTKINTGIYVDQDNGVQGSWLKYIDNPPYKWLSLLIQTISTSLGHFVWLYWGALTPAKSLQFVSY